MFDDDATAESGSNPEPPSDAVDPRAAADTTQTVQESSGPNPKMGVGAAADLIAPSNNALSTNSVFSTDAPPSISSPTVPQALSSAALSTSTAALAISGGQDAQTTATVVGGDTSPSPRNVANTAASGDATAIGNAGVAALPDGAASTTPSGFDSDHVSQLGTSADQSVSPPSLDPVKQLLGPTQTEVATDSGSTSPPSTANPGPTLGPIIDAPLDLASMGAPPSDGSITPVHPLDASAKPKTSDPLPAAAPTTKATAADSPSVASMIETGAKAILLSAHDGTVAAGGAAGLPAPKPAVIGAPAMAAPSITPDVLAARDQLASAIATANPAPAAITTLPTQAAPVPLVPTLGADTHTLHMHGG